VGVSACLLGEPVRYDGGHKRHEGLLRDLGGHVEWLPLCPEAEAGLGVPRETIRLERSEDNLRVIGTETGRDWTPALESWTERRLDELEQERLSGFVLKARSPSCGLGSTPVSGNAQAVSDGLFAAALGARFPDLPRLEEAGLETAEQRDRFLDQVFARHQLRRLLRPNWRAGDVVDFHAQHKLLLMAHSPETYEELGRLVAQAGVMAREEFAARYTDGFMQAARTDPPGGRHVNALMHAAGYITGLLDRAQRERLVQRVEEAREGEVALRLAKALIRDFAQRFGVAYLCRQQYLRDFPWRE